MLKKLINILLLSNGVSALDDKQEGDKWAKIRAEREAWEKRQAAAAGNPPSAAEDPEPPTR